MKSGLFVKSRSFVRIGDGSLDNLRGERGGIILLSGVLMALYFGAGR